MNSQHATWILTHLATLGKHQLNLELWIRNLITILLSLTHHAASMKEGIDSLDGSGQKRQVYCENIILDSQSLVWYLNANSKGVMHVFGKGLTLHKHLKSFIAKRVNSILVNLRYLRFKLLKYKENNKKTWYTFDHNFKNIPFYIMRKVSLEKYYFVLYNGALTLKISKMVLNPFCDKTLHL